MLNADLVQQRHADRVVGGRGGHHHHRDDQPQRVDGQASLAAVILSFLILNHADLR
jgi:hypothetical protein